jgi:uncharacterized membrane protein YdjX (TVP38/TMEM64 family)
MKRGLLIVGASVFVPIIPFLVVGELPGDRWLMRTDAHALLFGAVGCLLLAADLLLPIPSSVVGTLLAARLGAPVGGVLTLAGLMGSAGLGYLLGRLAPARLRARVGTTPSWVLVFLSRPVPVFAEALALSAGVLGMPPRRFLSASLAGNILYAAVLAFNGAHAIAGRQAGPGLVIPMLLPVAGFLLWRRWGGGGGGGARAR